MSRRLVTVAVSGGFDPLHVAHIRYLKAAKSLGDLLVVILNSDAFLRTKKGYAFMPQDERRLIMQSLSDVDWVVDCIDLDQTVSKTLEMLQPDIFAKGGDRIDSNMPASEKETCERMGIQLIYGVGGDKTHSSSKIVERARKMSEITKWEE